MATRSAAEWEDYLQSRHVPAARVRTMKEAVADPQIATRGAIHRHEQDGGFGVPVSAFMFEHDGPRVDTPPPRLGQHTDSILRDLGYSAGDIATLRQQKVI